MQSNPVETKQSLVELHGQVLGNLINVDYYTRQASIPCDQKPEAEKHQY